MLTGIKFKANPTELQKETLSQWMGCSKFIWNAKCQEDSYLSTFSRKYLPIGTYAPINQTYSQYKNKELSPWLSKCPSQILRNSAVNWFQTYQKFMGGLCGKPKKKKFDSKGSIHLTKELFSFDRCKDGVTHLFIGTKTNNIGFLSFKKHRSFKIPKSLYIKRDNGKYTVSFCYEDGISDEKLLTQKEHLKELSSLDQKVLEKITVGVDRGVARPVQVGKTAFDFTPEQKKKKLSKEKYIERYQRKLSKQEKGSNQSKKTKLKISKSYKKVANIRRDFCHQTSRKVVDSTDHVFIFEDLKTSNMTKRSKPVKKENGKGWEKNKAKAKSGLNKAILDKGWHMLENFTTYKAFRANKAIFKISAYQTSQECADCGHIHPNNRKSQSKFLCISCGYFENADVNAAKVIKKRAIKLIMNSGTELSKRGVLFDRGRGAKCKTRKTKVIRADSNEASKKIMAKQSLTV